MFINALRCEFFRFILFLRGLFPLFHFFQCVRRVHNSTVPSELYFPKLQESS